MTQAERIIGKFGGLTALARALGHRNPTTVQGWKKSGFIPAQRQPEVLALARQRGIALAPNDFFDLPDPDPGAGHDPAPTRLDAAE